MVTVWKRLLSGHVREHYKCITSCCLFFLHYSIKCLPEFKIKSPNLSQRKTLSAKNMKQTDKLNQKLCQIHTVLFHSPLNKYHSQKEKKTWSTVSTINGIHT